MKGADIIAVLLLGTGKGIDRTNQRSFAGRIYGADCQGGSRRLGSLIPSGKHGGLQFCPVHFEKHVRCGRCAARLLFGYLPGGGTLPSARASLWPGFLPLSGTAACKSCGNGPERRISHQRTGNRICKAVKA